MKIKMLTTALLFLVAAAVNAAEADLKPYLDSLTNFSGTILITKAGKPIELRSYGLANREHQVPNTNDTKYNIGSINKVFTKVALMQLRDEGKIDFAKTLRTYLPDYPSDIADKITIEQLLRHRSGVGDIFGPEYREMPKEKLRTLADYLPLFVHKPLAFEPGSQQKYSNAGYILLGLVIEKVSGMSYYDYVRTKIFTPLGMNDTDSYPNNEVVPKRATGYVKDGRANTHVLPGRGSSAGGGYSTASDLLRFATGAKKVLSAKAFDELIGDHPGVSWAGGGPGINAVVGLEGPYTMVVLSNYDPPSAEEVAKTIRGHLGVGSE